MADEAKTQEEAPKKKSPLKLIIIMVLVLAILGSGGFFAYKKFLAPKPKPAAEGEITAQGEKKESSANAKMPKFGQIFDLEPFIVNLADQKETRYLKAKISLELEGEKITDEMNKRLPQIRDIIIELLSSKSYEELATLHGKEHLKNEIVIRLNSVLKTGLVKNVFFTEFVMQ